MFERAAIILAAGLSRRMGAVNKLLIEFDGVPMIRRAVQTCVDLCDGPVTVVTGYQAKAIEHALNGLAVNFAFNPHYEAGQKTSVAAGLVATPDARATLIVLGDQPLLTAGHLSWLLTQHHQNDGPCITVPVQGDTHGNPLIIPHALKPRLLADRNNPGCQRFTRENPQLVQRVAATDPAFYSDIDTPEDLKTLQDSQANTG